MEGLHTHCTEIYYKWIMLSQTKKRQTNLKTCKMCSNDEVIWTHFPHFQKHSRWSPIFSNLVNVATKYSNSFVAAIAIHEPEYFN